MGELIKKFNKRKEALRSERSSFMNTWRELADYNLGYRGRFLTSDRNKGHKRNTKQYNNTAGMAVRTLGSGMAAGITSPARPWFKLGPPSDDPELAEYAPVKEWLHAVQKVMYKVYAHSNFYNAIHTLYRDIGVFATASMGVYENFQNVVFFQPEPVGSYLLSANGHDEIDTRYREYEMTVGACVKRFGIDNCSEEVKRQWAKGNTEMGVTITHVIEPNDDRDMISPLARDKRYRSVYYETRAGMDCSNDRFLLRSGFDDFPITAPRWDIAPGDVYGVNCPGLDAIGDTKRLQLGEKREAQALDKVANPPLQAPIELAAVASKGHMQGSEILYVDQTTGGITSIYGNYKPDLNAIRSVNKEVESRIDHAYYVDLFLMLSHSDRRQITAREIAEKQEEKLLMLGPVLERLHTELLDPIIDRTFNILNRAGVLPPPPPELVGRDMDVEYVSVLAQAQRMVATSGIERVVNFAGQAAAIWPEVRHKIDPVQALDEYSKSIGVDPRIVRSDDDVQDSIAAEAEAQQMAQAQEMAHGAAETAKLASETDTSGDNALTNMLQQAGLQ